MSEYQVNLLKAEQAKERERKLIQRSIWCDLEKTHMTLITCRSCVYRDNCQYREYGAMRKVKVHFDNWMGIL
jgi:hypothetical protein